MGTEVLRPQDFFYDRFRLSPPAFHRRKTYFPNGNGYGNPRPNSNSGYRKPVSRPERSDHKKKTQQAPQPQKPEPQQQLRHLPRRSSSAPPPPQPQKPDHPELQQLHLLRPRRSSSSEELHNNLAPSVTILRRGQSLDTIDATRMKRDLKNKTQESLVKRIYMDEDDHVYAGSAIFASPSPSSLPLPSFFSNINSNNSSSCNMNMISDNTTTTTTVINKDEFHDSATRDLRRLLRLE